MVLLVDPHRKTVEIASELGFGDSSGFFRAFRRWTGTTPSGRRKNAD
jgi:AraC-like DNA-binding protein